MDIIRIWKNSRDFVKLEAELDSLTRNSMTLGIRKMNFGTDHEANGRFYADYLKQLVKQSIFYSKLGSVHTFLQLSGFNNVLGDQFYYQNFVKKMVGGQYTTNCCMKMIHKVCQTWRQRWLAITGEGICYAKRYQLTNEGIVDMLFFDRTMKVRFGNKFTGQDFG